MKGFKNIGESYDYRNDKKQIEDLIKDMKVLRSIINDSIKTVEEKGLLKTSDNSDNKSEINSDNKRKEEEKRLIAKTIEENEIKKLNNINDAITTISDTVDFVTMYLDKNKIKRKEVESLRSGKNTQKDTDYMNLCRQNLVSSINDHFRDDEKYGEIRRCAPISTAMTAMPEKNSVRYRYSLFCRIRRLPSRTVPVAFLSATFSPPACLVLSVSGVRFRLNFYKRLYSFLIRT